MWPQAQSSVPSLDVPESLLSFPCRFSIKVMGLANSDFEAIVVEIVSRHVAQPEDTGVSTRHSRGGKWVSVTLTIEAQSRQQLDTIYRDLSSHELVVWVI
jgi:putative lipoic acid-binding regulatory protein